jgi:hypothetical protein
MPVLANAILMVLMDEGIVPQGITAEKFNDAIMLIDQEINVYQETCK